MSRTPAGSRTGPVYAPFLYKHVVSLAGRPVVGAVIYALTIDVAIDRRDAGQRRQHHDSEEREQLEHTAFIVVE